MDVARRKAAEWRKSSIDLRKLLEKRDKENAILHMRSSKLQHVANAAEDQVIKQADTIRRLEICVELFEDGKAPAKVAEQHIAMKAMQTELHLKVRPPSAFPNGADRIHGIAKFERLALPSLSMNFEPKSSVDSGPLAGCMRRVVTTVRRCIVLCRSSNCSMYCI